MEHTNAQSAAELFRRAFVGECPLPDETAAECVQGLKNGSIPLFGAAEDNALLPLDERTLAGVEKLESMHAAFAAFCQECRSAAAAYNAASPRLGFYFCQLADDEAYRWQINWIRGDLGIYQDLFVALDFLFLSPKAEYSVAFGTYCNHGCSSPLGVKTPFYMDHSALDIAAFARHNADEKSKKESQKFSARTFAGRRPFPCPFCGHQFVKSGLMGRKCPNCKRVLPKN